MAGSTLHTLRVALTGAALLTALTTGAASAAGRVTADADTSQYGVSTAELAEMQRLPSVTAASERLTSSARGPLDFVRPVIGPITTPFGEPGPYWRLGYHPGIDLAVPVGTPVKAVQDGVVLEAEPDGYNSGYGHYVKIDHGNGLHSLYGHLSTLQVQPGDQVVAGQVIALSGNTGLSTGPHLHLEIRLNGEKRDPAPYLGL